MLSKGYEKAAEDGVKLLVDAFDKYAIEQGLTGFQASWIMLQFISKELHKECFRLLDYENMLFPQYEHDFREISKSTWEWMQKKAAEYLKEGGGCKEVRDHWQSIVNGVVPFGYKIRE